MSAPPDNVFDDLAAQRLQLFTDEELKKELDGLIAELDSPENNKEESESAALSHLQAYNWGLTNMLGAPSDIGTMLTNQVMERNVMGMGNKAQGIPNTQIQSPAIGSEQIRELTERFNITSREPPKGFTQRAARMAGELTTVLPPVLSAGKNLAMQAPRNYNAIEQVLINTYRNRFAAMGAESVAIAGASAAGEYASENYPDSPAAEAIAELTGAVVPGSLVAATRFAGNKLPLTSVLKETFTKSGSERRAANRLNELSTNPDIALRNVMAQSELNLDPMTASGDQGVYALFKAAINQDHKLLGRMSDATVLAMNNAKTAILEGGNPEDVILYLKALRSNAAARAQNALINLGSETSPVKASRVVRSIINTSHKQARDLERIIWQRLPNDGQIDFNPIMAQHESMLRSRAVADDASELPGFLDELIGKIDKNGNWKPGALANNSTLKEVKILKSRIGREMDVEGAMDAPNANKLRILGEAEAVVLEELKKFSPEYGRAVDYSRSINQSFRHGKVGKLLGYKRGGEARVPADGTLEFMFSGSKRDVSEGLRQLSESSPAAMEDLKNGIKSIFIAQAAPDAGVVNPVSANRFMRNNEHILSHFPDVRADIERSIKTQKVVDEFLGAKLDSSLSTLQKEKSAASLYLNNSPEKAISGVLNTKTDAGQAKLMQELVNVTNQDSSGKATKGLKAAYQQMLIRHSETPDNVEVLSGKKMLALLNDTDKGARVLYQDEPLKLIRMKKIAEELRKIEIRNTTKEAKGGIISDAPNKILSIISGTVAARAGAAAGTGSSGASLRTASIFTKEWNNFMGKLTNDGAQTLLIQAAEDPQVFRMLMERATNENLVKASELFQSTLLSQGISMAGRSQQGQQNAEPSIQDEIELLERALKR